MPTKASITTRTGKGSPLSTAEMDGNLEALRDQSIGFADDTSTVLSVDSGNTITIAGAGSVSTALSGTTLTVTGTGISASSTDTFTNKTFDANGTGNAISNLEVADMAATAVVTVAETLASNDSDTAFVTAGAIIDYVDAQDANIASDTLTFTNKTFDANGTGNSITNIEVADLASGVLDTDLASVSASDDTLASAKAIKAYADTKGTLNNISEDATPQLGGNLDVNGNSIVSVSNADININPDGTGAVIIGGDLHIGGDTETLITTSTGNVLVLNGGTNGWVIAGNATDADFNTNFSTSTHHHNGLISYYQNLALTPGTDTRHYTNPRIANIKLDGTNSSNTNDRYRVYQELLLDLNGSEVTATGVTRGAMNAASIVIENTSATAGVMGETKGLFSEILSNAGSGDITMTNTAGLHIDIFAEGGNQQTMTNVYGVKFNGVEDDTGGNLTVTNEYGYYYGNQNNATNTYAFYSENETAKSHLGTIARYRENVVTLADDSTADVTVDYNTSQIHTYTLEDAKEFRFDNIPTGGTVTLIITQSQGGSHTATFVNGADSTAVKFAGGAPTLTTDDGAIDVVTVFNDGTNLLGNIAQDFKSA